MARGLGAGCSIPGDFQTIIGITSLSVEATLKTSGILLLFTSCTGIIQSQRNSVLKRCKKIEDNSYQFYLVIADCLSLSFLRKQESRPFQSALCLILSAIFNCNWYHFVHMEGG